MSDTKLPTNRAILAVYLFYEARFLIALTPKWLLKNWCSSWSIHSEYIYLFFFSSSASPEKFVRGKIMQSRNWRLFVKVDSSVRNDQHCICDIVYIAAVKRDRWPLVLPPPLKKSAKNVGWQFEKKACLQVSLQF